MVSIDEICFSRESQSSTEIKYPADCRNEQRKMSAKLMRIPKQERWAFLNIRKKLLNKIIAGGF